MLHLNAKLKKLRTPPAQPKKRADRKFELKMVREPAPKITYNEYWQMTVVLPWL